jgi:Flp pilus assembly protein TadD
LGSATEALRRALALAPEDLTARHHLSMVLLARGQPEAAAKELERILVLDPGHVPAQLDLAIMSISQGQFREALRRLDAILQSDATNARALFYRAIALDQLERREEATEILQMLAKGTPGKYTEQAHRYLAVR